VKSLCNCNASEITVEIWLTPGFDVKYNDTSDTPSIQPSSFTRNTSSFGLATEPTSTNMAPSTSNNTGLTALAAAASSSAATGASSGRNMADDDASLDEVLGINDHHGAPEVQEVAPTKDPIEDASLDDVEFIDEDANEPQLPVQKAKRGQQPHLTKIKSMLGKAVKDISRAVPSKILTQNNNAQPPS
jgi:hypothetical protein